MASPEGKKGSSSGGRRRSSQALRTPSIQREPGAPVTIHGWLLKQGSDGLMLWKKRWFVLSKYCLFYYHGPEEEKVLGSILLPSYTIRPCSSEDRVYRKYAFKAEHRNTRSYYFAAETKESMIQWMNALSLATILHEHCRSESTLQTNKSDIASLDSTHASGTGTLTINGDEHFRNNQIIPRRLYNGVDNESYKLNASFDSTISSRQDDDSSVITGQRQPLYANAPPKPKRLNTSREYSSSPDRSPEREKKATQMTTPPTEMYGNYSKQYRLHYGMNRPVSTEVTVLTQRNSPLPNQNTERRTPDAYGRFKPDYEDVYNNSSHSSGSLRTSRIAATLNAQPKQRDCVATNSNYAYRNEKNGRLPPRPHSADILEMNQSYNMFKRISERNQLLIGQDPLTFRSEQSDYWSEENYAQQVRQSAALRNYPRSRGSSHSSNGSEWKGAANEQTQKTSPKNPVPIIPRVACEDEISRDVKESALWSYVKQSSNNMKPNNPGFKAMKLSNSQENLIDTNQENTKMFNRSASARLPRLKQVDALTNTLQESKQNDTEMKKIEQREESMKRLLEWKQRMLQSPLTRKSGQKGGSERSTPTPQIIDSPRLHSQQKVDQESPNQRNDFPYSEYRAANSKYTGPATTLDYHHHRVTSPTAEPSLIGANMETRRPSSRTLAPSPIYTSGNRDTVQRTSVRTSKDILQEEHNLDLTEVNLTSGFPTTSDYFNEDWSSSLAFRASLKRSSMNKIKLNEADVRKEFTYEYVSGDNNIEVRPKIWPISQPSLMREKSSAVQDLRARSESPSANKVLGEHMFKETLQPVLPDLSGEAQASHFNSVVNKVKPNPPPKPVELALQAKRLESFSCTDHQLQVDVNNFDNLTCHNDNGQRSSLAESLPESLAGFAATIISEGTNSPTEPTVSPLMSECDWQTTNMSPAPLPDIMSLTSATSPVQLSPRTASRNVTQDHTTHENLYMNTSSIQNSLSTVEDHYLPMTSTKLSTLARSQQPLPLTGLLCIEKTEYEENTYVEMHDGDNRRMHRPLTDERSSVFAGVFDPSYRPTPESPRYSEISECHTEKDQPHYEFIYKAASQNEPVYMEVPNIEDSVPRLSPEVETNRRQQSGIQESLNSDGTGLMNNVVKVENSPVPEAKNTDSSDLDLIAPPRNPRFSLSDTFRPASYFLSTSKSNSKRLETISSREDINYDGQESSDSELVSPPSIPTTPPPIEEFKSVNKDSMPSLRTVNNSVPTHGRSHSLDMENVTGRVDGRLLLHTTQINDASCSSRNSLKESDCLSKRNSSSQDVARRRPLTIVRSLEDLLTDTDDKKPLEAMNRMLPAFSHFKGSTQSLTLNNSSPIPVSCETWRKQPVYENVTLSNADSSISSPTAESRQDMSPVTENSCAKPVNSASHHQRGNSTLSTLSLASSASSSSVARSEQSGAPYYYSDLLGKSDIDKVRCSTGSELSLNTSGRDSILRGRNGQPKLFSTDRLRSPLTARESPCDRPASSLKAENFRSAHSSQVQLPDVHPQISSIRSEFDVGAVRFTEEHNQSVMQINHLVQSQGRTQTPDLLANNRATVNRAMDRIVFQELPENGSCLTKENASSVIRNGEVMRRVRSLEGLLEDNSETPTRSGGSGLTVRNANPESQVGHINQNTAGGAVALSSAAHDSLRNASLNRRTETPPSLNHNSRSNERQTSVLKETPRYARDPTLRPRPSTMNRSERNRPVEGAGDFSPWDEDRLWRDKLRTASIRHTRSLDMLDEVHKPKLVPVTANEEASAQPSFLANEDNDSYERLLQYSATLERTKRGQTYLDGYVWDEVEQRFRKPTDSPLANGNVPRVSSTPKPSGNHFLEDSLPPTFEIDREKLRQWDLMSTAPVLTASETGKEGGRRSLSHSKNSAVTTEDSQKTTVPASIESVTSVMKLRPNSSQHEHVRGEESEKMNSCRKEEALSLTFSNPVHSPRLPSCSHSPDSVASPCITLHHGNNPEMSLYQPDLTIGSSARLAKHDSNPHSGLVSPEIAGKSSINGVKGIYRNGQPHDNTKAVLITTQPTSNISNNEEMYHSDSEMPRKKGKLPPMIGQGRESSNTDRIPLSAGDLLGRTHEELVLLLIQLRRQSSALIKARDSCLLEMESQIKLASIDLSHRQECLSKMGDLKRHVKELEKQLEKLKPLINLVDNMVKLGSLYPTNKQVKNLTSPGPKMNHSESKPTPVKPISTQAHSSQYDSPVYSNQRQWKITDNPVVSHLSPHHGSHYGDSQHGYNVQEWQGMQISQLESKHQQLAALENFVREEGVTIQRLTHNQNVLKLAIKGIREQTNTALQKGDYAEVEHCRQQQLFLERELSQVHSLLAQSSKRLEDTAVEINRIEQEISTLHQQLHRLNSGSRMNRSPQHSLNRSSGREMAWLEAELIRVQQHISQLQLRRQELSSQIGGLTDMASAYGQTDVWTTSMNGANIAKRKPSSTWYETDLDLMYTVDRGTESAEMGIPGSDVQASLYINSMGLRQQEYNKQTVPIDINEADERMKRYYGIISKDKPAEIRTVRIVKRESEKRQRDKTKKYPFDDLVSSGLEELAEEEATRSVNNEGDDPIMNDPVLSQFSHILTLPRRNKENREKRHSAAEFRPRRSSFSHDNEQDVKAEYSKQYQSNRRRNTSTLLLTDRNTSLSLEAESGEESVESTQASPVLTPVYTSNAAREIVEEMRRQDMKAARRAVPRAKRRHVTVSCSQPLALEALQHNDTRGNKGRAKDDVDMERALRFHHPFAPDVVRSTIGRSVRINDKTIDRIFCAPDKILIPERYVPEQEVEELNEEEKQKRLKKAESIRRMLTGSTPIDLPRPPTDSSTLNDNLEPSKAKQLWAKERKQRDHFLELNHVLVEEIKEKSKMVAAQNLGMESQSVA